MINKKVKPGPSPPHRFAIALRSPDVVVETGLPMGPSEKKSHKSRLRGNAEHFLRSGLRAKSAELLPFLAIFRGIQSNFSASQTAWRSGKDSNPRYRSETCKSRRLRKLRGIKSFKNSLRLPASRGVVANRWDFQRSSKANPWRFCSLN
jgi:hypothetical protein